MTLSNAPIKEPIAEVSRYLTRVWVRWFEVVQKQLNQVAPQTISIVSANSPYTIPYSSVNLICDTDAGAITVNYPVGEQGADIRVANAGSSGNDVTLVPNGSETIRGEATQTLLDEDILRTTFDATKFWY